jgi:hypothetical protein
LVEVFRSVRELLTDDGSFWLNLGDSYAGSGGAGGDYRPGGKKEGQHKYKSKFKPNNNLKPKDLMMIPQLVALALRQDGWWLRSQIPWIKRNPMPEDPNDRPSRAIEYVFLFSKSQTCYYDQLAVSLKGKCPAGTRGAKGSVERAGQKGVNSRPAEYAVYDGFRNRRDTDWFMESWQGLYEEEDEPLAFVVNTKGYAGAHFATFPTRLVEPCILAGSSACGCCPKCGKQWVMQTESISDKPNQLGPKAEQLHKGGKRGETKLDRAGRVGTPTRQAGPFTPSCQCDISPTPSIILDPFTGSGTVGEVSARLRRHFLGVELNEAYKPLIEKRIAIGEEEGRQASIEEALPPAPVEEQTGFSFE